MSCGVERRLTFFLAQDTIAALVTYQLFEDMVPWMNCA